MPNLKQIFAGAKEIFSDLLKPQQQHSEEENLRNYKRMLPLMGVIPLAWIGRIHSDHVNSYNDDNSNNNNNNIRDGDEKVGKKSKKKKFTEENWKNKKGRERYIVRKFNDEWKENEEEEIVMGKNCLITHLFAVIEMRRYYCKFGLIKLGKKGSLVDKKRIILLKDSFELDLKDFNYASLFLIRKLEGNCLKFSILNNYLTTAKFELNEMDVEKSKVLLESSTETDIYSAINSERVIYPTISDDSDTIENYEFFQYDSRLCKLQIENSEIKQCTDFILFDESKFVFPIQRLNPQSRTIEKYLISDILYKFENDKPIPTDIEIIPDNLKETITLIRVTPLTSSLHLLMFKKINTVDDITVDDYFSNVLIWMIFNLDSFTVIKVSPVFHPITVSKLQKDKSRDLIVIDGNYNSNLKHFQELSFREMNSFFSTCVLKPFESNPDLVYLEMFFMVRKKNDDNNENFGRLFTFCFKVPNLALSCAARICSFYDVNIQCQH